MLCKLVFRNTAFLLLTFLLILSCSKPEEISSINDSEEVNDNNYAAEINGEWNLVFSSEGRVIPKSYSIGDIKWTFDDESVTINDHISNYNDQPSYTIIDTLGETHLRLNGYYYGNIESISEDSLVIDSNKYIGCGGVKVFVR